MKMKRPPPQRVSIDRRRGAFRKGWTVSVDGRVEFTKTMEPMEVFNLLRLRGYSGKVTLWREGRPVGEVDIETEARRVLDRLRRRAGR